MQHEADKPRPGPAREPAPRDDVVVAQGRCPFCHEAVKADAGGWVACASCLGRHHAGCWDEGGRCAACGHGERLKADAPAAVSGQHSGRAVVAVMVAVMVSVFVAGGAWVLSARRAAMSDAVAVRLAEAEAARRWAADEGARQREAARVALAALADADRGDPAEAARLRGVEDALAKLAFPQANTLVLPEQESYLLLPPRDHPELEAVSTQMLGTMERTLAESEDRPTAWAYLGYVRATRGEGQAGIEAANRGLDLAPTAWLGWLARGRSRLVTGDLEGADRDLLVAQALCGIDPTWPLLARADLAEARGDVSRALELCRDVQAVGELPAKFGQREALAARIARLEAATAGR